MKRVAFQGDSGAFSESAALAFGGKDTQAIPCREFTDVAAAVRNGSADFGVLPVENSIAGLVAGSRAVLASREFQVVGEIVLPIHHCLIARPGVSLEHIRRALSHPVALAQCGDFLRAHPVIEPVAWYDTAGAARYIAENEDDTAAAIASKGAAAHYGLVVMAENVEDSPDNRTRFVVIARSIAID